MVDFSDLQHEWLIATGRYVEDWHLGNSSGEIYDIDGLVYVHQRNANGDVVREKSVRGPTQGAVPMDKWGIAVFVGRDFENKEALVGISFTGAIQQGFPPGLANPGDLNAYGDVISQDIIHLKVTPTDPPSLNLAVQEHYYIMGRTFYHIVQDQIDVSSLIPAGPNEQCLIGINAKRDGTFEAFASTAQDTLDPLDDSDVQELLDQFTPGGIAAYAYWVNDQTTAITDANIFQDLRPLYRPDFCDVMSVSPSGTLTISSGAVTTDRSYHHISAEAGSSDDLDTITEVEDRQLLILQAAPGHTITVKHDTGNITLNGESDIVLSGSKTLILFFDGTSWSDTAFGSGGYADSGYWYGYADSGDIQTIEDGDTFTIAGDGSTIETVAQDPKTVVVGVKDGGIDTTQLADDAVTKAKLDPEVYAEPDAIGSTTPAAGTFTEVNIDESGHLYQVNTGVNERFTLARNAKWDGAAFRRTIADNHANIIQFTPDGEIDFAYNTDAFDTVGSVPTFATAMRIDANGNVGIGTTSIAARADIHDPAALGSSLSDERVLSWLTGDPGDASVAGLRISQRRIVAGSTHRSAAVRLAWSVQKGAASVNDGRLWYEMGNESDAALTLLVHRWGNNAEQGTDGTEWMRLQNNGLFIGVSSASQATGSRRIVLGVQQAGSTTPNAEILLGQQTSGTTGDVLGQLSFGSLDVSSDAAGRQAAIKAVAEEAAGRNAGLAFYTGTGTQDSSVERMRITAAGELNLPVAPVFGGSSVDGIQLTPAGKINIVNQGVVMEAARIASDGVLYQFRRNAGGVGSISVTTTATAFNTSSAAAVKKGIKNADRGHLTSKFNQITLREFEFLADPGHVVYGFVAEELHEVYPEAVTLDAKDPTNHGIDYSKLVPVLFAKVQSISEEIQQLKEDRP